ncbi:small integral membrane protein 43-like [Brienomyrus brachyistius]|uniref:small integral membrane protein 43-like n=1 Tax=Brienomyrus brachyistius TaxID=42636 RepID=UPI0020B3B3C9|nr:small integral membrane protein 43-like [Brienomyrus brachyistius]
MPAPRMSLVPSASWPVAVDWAWNLGIYVAMFSAMLLLMLLLLWLLIKQLRDSVGNAALKPGPSIRRPPGQHAVCAP